MWIGRPLSRPIGTDTRSQRSVIDVPLRASSSSAPARGVGRSRRVRRQKGRCLTSRCLLRHRGGVRLGVRTRLRVPQFSSARCNSSERRRPFAHTARPWDMREASSDGNQFGVSGRMNREVQQGPEGARRLCSDAREAPPCARRLPAERHSSRLCDPEPSPRSSPVGEATARTQRVRVLREQ